MDILTQVAQLLGGIALPGEDDADAGHRGQHLWQVADPLDTLEVVWNQSFETLCALQMVRGSLRRHCAVGGVAVGVQPRQGGDRSPTRAAHERISALPLTADGQNRGTKTSR